MLGAKIQGGVSQARRKCSATAVSVSFLHTSVTGRCKCSEVFQYSGEPEKTIKEHK